MPCVHCYKPRFKQSLTYSILYSWDNKEVLTLLDLLTWIMFQVHRYNYMHARYAAVHINPLHTTIDQLKHCLLEKYNAWGGVS